MTESNKEAAASGDVREAYSRFVSPGFKQHNPFFAGTAQTLMAAMEDNARQNPNNVLDVKQAIAEGAFVAVHSHARQNPDDHGGSVIHIFRFENGRIVEIWDVGQPVPGESPNPYGLFWMKKISPSVGNTEQVNEFMDKLDHPFKAEVEMVSEIIKNVNRDITEQIKWKAPTFSYQGEYLVTFNLWEKGRIHLAFHNQMISKGKSKLLEGDYDHRRMAYFADKDEIQAKQSSLEKVLRDLIKLQKKQKEKV